MIIIKPIVPFPVPLATPIYSGDHMNNFIFYPAFFETEKESRDYLSSLDSDTRHYVMNHTDEFRSKRDIIECVSRLRYESQE